jgi:hypothetical protein
MNREYYPKGNHIVKMPFLSPLFKKWQKIILKISRKWIKENDVPWWYTERASLSLFSGAIWQSGGYVFEEFSVNREIKNRKKNE